MDTLDVTIDKLVFGGDGLAHAGGNTVFVPYVLPEEVVRIDAVERKKKFVRGRLREVLHASPLRVAPACPHFGTCGGCHYQHIPYTAQLQYKGEILRESLRRLGRIDWPGPVQTHGSPPFGHRNRAQWKVRPLPGNPGSASIGYFQASTSTLVPVRECPILSPRLAGVLDSLRPLLAGGALPAAIQEIEAFVDAADERVLLNISVAQQKGAVAALSGVLRTAIPGLDSILFHEERSDRFELDGPGYIHYLAAGNRFRVGHLSFFQVNRFLVDELALAIVGDAAGALAFDLFAGVGLFTLALSRRFDRVLAVDSNLAAVRDLQANIEASGSAAQAAHLDTEAFLAGTTETPDFVVLDPPRAGVSPKALSHLLRIGPQRITYLSCDPATLARDLAILTSPQAAPAGYRIRELHLFDIFPQTYHIEALVRLERLG